MGSASQHGGSSCLLGSAGGARFGLSAMTVLFSAVSHACIVSHARASSHAFVSATGPSAVVSSPVASATSWWTVLRRALASRSPSSAASRSSRWRSMGVATAHKRL
eukprot:4297267-Prymnesium_polylepis.3